MRQVTDHFYSSCADAPEPPITNNDILRSVRFIMNYSDARFAEILAMADYRLPLSEISSYLKKEDELGYEECADVVLAHFLNGLVILKRGKDDSRPPMHIEVPLSNNIVLKKLRVAFNLKEDDILRLMKDIGFEIGKSELSALFRRKDHSNYRNCGDQFLRNFLKGLATHVRGLPAGQM